MPEKKVHDAVAGIHHDNLEEGSTKSKVGKVLDSKAAECFILLLVLVDICLLSVEAGIDHHFLCIHGEVVPRPVGQPPPHHFFLEHSNGFLSWQPTPIFPSVTFPAFHDLKLGVDSATEGIHQALLSSAAVDSKSRGNAEQSLTVAPHTQIAKSKTYLNHKLALKPEEKEPHHEDPGGHSGHEDSKAHHGHAEGEAHGEHGAHGHGPDEVLMCETRDGHHAHHIAHSCHIASIAILFIFLVEISVKYWVNPDAFIHNWFLILDATVIIVSILTDTLVMWWVESSNPKNIDKSDVAAIAGALLFVRCWRVIRIAHGLGEHMHHAHEKEHKAEHLQEELHHTKEELQQVKQELDATKKELAKVRGH
jgi:hypothetical protein